MLSRGMELNTSILALYCLDPMQYFNLQLLLVVLVEGFHVSSILLMEGEFELIFAVMLSALGWKQSGMGGSMIKHGGTAKKIVEVHSHGGEKTC